MSGILEKDQKFYGHGKILLTGEYAVLRGAECLGLPATVGQELKVHYRHSYNPYLYWKSFDRLKQVWFEAKFEFWHFEIVETKSNPEALLLQKILRQVRKQNPHFLRDEVDVLVETFLQFPREWGLGSSSSLIYCIAQWAYVGPYELLFQTFGGSGYDIACARSEGPVVYQLEGKNPKWTMVKFNPAFKRDLYFIYLGKKQSSSESLQNLSDKLARLDSFKNAIGQVTRQILTCNELSEFEKLIAKHEDIIHEALELPKVKDIYFTDYWGEVKSLGAWGGDFILATSSRPYGDVLDYFQEKGFKVCIPYIELIKEGKGND